MRVTTTIKRPEELTIQSEGTPERLHWKPEFNLAINGEVITELTLLNHESTQKSELTITFSIFTDDDSDEDEDEDEDDSDIDYLIDHLKKENIPYKRKNIVFGKYSLTLAFEHLTIKIIHRITQMLQEVNAPKAVISTIQEITGCGIFCTNPLSKAKIHTLFNGYIRELATGITYKDVEQEIIRFGQAKHP